MHKSSPFWYKEYKKFNSPLPRPHPVCAFDARPPVPLSDGLDTSANMYAICIYWPFDVSHFALCKDSVTLVFEIKRFSYEMKTKWWNDHSVVNFPNNTHARLVLVGLRKFKGPLRDIVSFCSSLASNVTLSTVLLSSSSSSSFTAWIISATTIIRQSQKLIR